MHSCYLTYSVGNVTAAVYKKDLTLSCNHVNRSFKSDLGVFTSVSLIYLGVYLGIIERLHNSITKTLEKLSKKMLVLK